MLIVQFSVASFLFFLILLEQLIQFLNLAQHMRDKATAQPLFDHIRTSEEWDHATMQLVDWSSLTPALNDLPFSAQMFVHKLCYNFLPVHTHMERFGQHHTDVCPSCLGASENLRHIWQCPRRTQWRGELIDDIRKCLRRLETQRDMEILLLHGIAAGLQDATFRMEIDGTPPEVHQAIKDQNKIGWDHIVKGRLAREWMRLQSQHIQRDATLRNEPARSTTAWRKAFFVVLWSSIYEGCWKVRNKDKHGHDKADYEIKKKIRLRPQLQGLYSMKPDLSDHDQQLLGGTVQERMDSMPADVLEAWIRNTTPLIAKLTRDNIRRSREGTNDIRSFFIVPEPRPPPAPGERRRGRRRSNTRPAIRLRQLGIQQAMPTIQPLSDRCNTPRGPIPYQRASNRTAGGAPRPIPMAIATTKGR